MTDEKYIKGAWLVFMLGDKNASSRALIGASEQLLKIYNRSDDGKKVILESFQEYPDCVSTFERRVEQLKLSSQKDVANVLEIMKSGMPGVTENQLPDSQEKATGQELRDDTSFFVEKAETAYYDGRYAEARDLAAQALKIDPNNARARQFQAKAAARLQEPAKTVSEEREIPRKVLRLYRRARSYAGAYEYQRAAEVLEEALKIAEEAGVPFEDAENMLLDLQEKITGQELREAALGALEGDDIATARRKLEGYYEQTKEAHIEGLLQALRALEEAHRAYQAAPNLPATLERMSKALAQAAEFPELQRTAFYKEIEADFEPWKKHIAAETWERAQNAFRQAEEARALDAKIRLYREAADNAQTVVRFGGGYSEDVYRLKNEADDRFERLEKVRRAIEQARKEGAYPAGVSPAVLEELQALAPQTLEAGQIAAARRAAKDVPGWLVLGWFFIGLGVITGSISLVMNIPGGFVPFIVLTVLGLAILAVGSQWERRFNGLHR